MFGSNMKTSMTFFLEEWMTKAVIYQDLPCCGTDQMYGTPSETWTHYKWSNRQAANFSNSILIKIFSSIVNIHLENLIFFFF